MKFTARTISAITIPGGSHTHGSPFSVTARSPRRSSRQGSGPAADTEGQEASDASSRIAWATPKVATTRSGPTMFGSR